MEICDRKTANMCASQPKFMVCGPSFCSFSPVLVVVQVLTYIFSLCLLFYDHAKPQLNFQGKRLLLFIGIIFACFCR